MDELKLVGGKVEGGERGGETVERGLVDVGNQVVLQAELDQLGLVLEGSPAPQEEVVEPIIQGISIEAL